MKPSILLGLMMVFSALGLVAQERLARLPIGDQAIREEFARHIYRIRLSISRVDDLVRVTNKSIMSSNSWSGHLFLIKNLAEEISANLDPNTEYVWWWGLFSHLQTGALIGMTREEDTIRFEGNKEEIQSSIKKMIERIDHKVFEGYMPIYAPGVKAVRFIQRDDVTGEIYIEEFSPNGAYGCPPLLKRAGDGWLWLPAVNLRPIHDRDKRFYLFYSDDLSDWDEFDGGWGSKGDIVASSRGPIPPRLVISRIEDLRGGSSGFLVRVAGLEPEREYTLLLAGGAHDFTSNAAARYSVVADRLGVISLKPRLVAGCRLFCLSDAPSPPGTLPVSVLCEP